MRRSVYPLVCWYSNPFRGISAYLQQHGSLSLLYVYWYIKGAGTRPPHTLRLPSGERHIDSKKKKGLYFM